MTVAATAGDQVVQHRGWFIFLSFLLIVAGAAAIAFPVLSTFAVEFWAAIAFAIAGVAQTIHAVAARSWGGFFWGLLVGLLGVLHRGLVGFSPRMAARQRREVLEVPVIVTLNLKRVCQ